MGQTATDESNIREVIGAWFQPVEKRNLNDVLAHHSPDILMFDVPTIELQGKKAYKESWKDFLDWLGNAGKVLGSEFKSR